MTQFIIAYNVGDAEYTCKVDAPNHQGVFGMTLGEYLRGLRLCQNEMSLDKMAEKIGCSKSYLWDVENDRVMPTLSKAAVMAKAYKTSLNQMGRYL